MENKPIIIIKPKSLSSKDKEKLSKAGNLVVESDYPASGFTVIKEPIHLVFTNCYQCGERIYVHKERLAALKVSKANFYCSYGHSQFYK